MLKRGGLFFKKAFFSLIYFLTALTSCVLALFLVLNVLSPAFSKEPPAGEDLAGKTGGAIAGENLAGKTGGATAGKAKENKLTFGKVIGDIRKNLKTIVKPDSKKAVSQTPTQDSTQDSKKSQPAGVSNEIPPFPSAKPSSPGALSKGEFPKPSLPPKNQPVSPVGDVEGSSQSAPQAVSGQVEALPITPLPVAPMPSALPESSAPQAVSGQAGGVPEGPVAVSGQVGDVPESPAPQAVSGQVGDVPESPAPQAVSGQVGDVPESPAPQVVSGQAGDVPESPAPQAVSGQAGDVPEGPAPQVVSGQVGDVPESPAPQAVSGQVGDVPESPAPQVVSGQAGDVPESPAPQVVSGQAGDVPESPASQIVSDQADGSSAEIDKEEAKRFPSSEIGLEIRSYMVPFTYESLGRKDPFKDPTVIKGQIEAGIPLPKSPLEKHELAQIKLKGVIWDTKRPKALFQLPGDAGFFTLFKGDKVGRKGIIFAIRESEVVILKTRPASSDTDKEERIIKIKKIDRLSPSRQG